MKPAPPVTRTFICLRSRAGRGIRPRSRFLSILTPEERLEPAVEFPKVNLRRDVVGRVHAQNADSHVDDVHILIGKPCRNGATAVTGVVGMRLPAYFRGVQN